MPNDNEALIEKLRAKYGSLMRSNGVHAPMTVGAGMGNGMRFTGYGRDNEPSGVTHKGEMVVEAPMVRAAGGPEDIRHQVEEMARDNRVASYQTGTGEGTVPNIDKYRDQMGVSRGTSKTQDFGYSDPMGRKVNTNLDPNLLKKATPRASQFSQLQGLSHGAAAFKQPAANTPEVNKSPVAWETFKPQAPVVKLDARPENLVDTFKPEPPVVKLDAPPKVEPQKFEPQPKTTEVAPEEKPSHYRDITSQAIEKIQKTAAGESEADRIARERMEGRLAGQEATEQMSLAQSQAQRGMEGPAADVEQAMLQRQQDITAHGERAALEERVAERAERTLVPKSN